MFICVSLNQSGWRHCFLKIVCKNNIARFRPGYCGNCPNYSFHCYLVLLNFAHIDKRREFEVDLNKCCRCYTPMNWLVNNVILNIALCAVLRRLMNCLHVRMKSARKIRIKVFYVSYRLVGLFLIWSRPGVVWLV